VNPDESRWDEAISAYRRYYELSGGDRKERLRADDHWWAWEAVDEAAREGSLPLAVLDALVCDPAGDSDYRAYVAAGPLEDLLKLHADAFANGFADRIQTEQSWAEALRGVCLDHPEWSALPEKLRSIVAEPRTSDQVPSVQRPRAGRRPSKRQERRGGRRGG
jgi:hypothetical protein